MSSPTRFRLRRVDRALDPRTKTYSTRAEATAARGELPEAERPDWEISPHTSGSKGGKMASADRSRPIRSFTLAPAVFTAIEGLAGELKISKSRVVEEAVLAYAEARRR